MMKFGEVSCFSPGEKNKRLVVPFWRKFHGSRLFTRLLFVLERIVWMAMEQWLSESSQVCFLALHEGSKEDTQEKAEGRPCLSVFA